MLFAICWYSSTIRSSFGTGSLAGATMTASAPRSCAMRDRDTAVRVPVALVPTMIGTRLLTTATALRSGVALASLSRFDSPRTPRIVTPSTPEATMNSQQPLPGVQIEAFVVLKRRGKDGDNARKHPRIIAASLLHFGSPTR